MSDDADATDELPLALDRHATEVIKALKMHARVLREHTNEMAELRRALHGHADAVEHSLRRLS